MFQGIKTQQITEQISLFTLDLKELKASDLGILDANIVEICEGKSGTSVELVKANLYEFLKTKDKRTQYGAVAEFFVHLFVRHLGLKQEFLFLNLEEGSIKKGFDGCFSKGNDIFLVESKSGSSNTKGISHLAKSNEAYRDICSVVQGTSDKSKNNPWRNAYNHASHIDIAPQEKIRSQLKDLSDKYDSGEFRDISNFKIILASTIFQEAPIDPNFHSNSLINAATAFKAYKARESKVFCITKSTFDTFLKYLSGAS